MMSPRPCCSRSALSCGTTVRWAAASEEMPVAAAGGAGERRQRRHDRGRIALALQAGELVDLQLAYRRVVDLEQLDRRFRFGPVHVDADDRLLAGIDARLGARRRLLDS